MKTKSASMMQILSRPSVLAGLFGFFLVLSAIALSSSNFLAFFSLEGLMVVGGGVVAVAFMSFQTSDVQTALRAIREMFGNEEQAHATLHRDVMDILSWARVVKEKGLLGLEKNVDNGGIDDAFVRYGLNMVISSYTADEVRAMMETAADAQYERDTVPVHILQTMASHAPAFGMVGTLVGMVTMLYSLGDNVNAIGSTLAISFLATLYGVVSARMIYMPAAARLLQKVEGMRFRNHLVTEGMVMLVGNKSSIYIRDRLSSFLQPEMQGAIHAPALHNKPAPLKAISR
jgi:chemotaxis protein MotA